MFNSWKVYLRDSLKLLSLPLLVSCTAPGFDVNTEEGRAAIIDQVNIYLTDSNCTGAIDLIEPLYESGFTNNYVRLMRAASHACRAGVNYFNFVNTLASGPNNFLGTNLWKTLTTEFPSSTGDGSMESSWFSQDAIMSSLNSGEIITSANVFNEGTTNEGTLDPNQRPNDANSYLIFTAMAGIGTAQNRFGDPNSEGLKRDDLPWDSLTDMDETGCGYAASIVNMLDGINATGDVLSGATATALNDIHTAFNTIITLSCSLGCQGLPFTGTPPQVDTDCNFTATDCSPCPSEIRNRSTCNLSTKAKCAAAGIVRMINDDTTFGWLDAS